MNNITRTDKARKLLEEDIAHLVSNFESYNGKDVEEIRILRNSGKVQVTIKVK